MVAYAVASNYYPHCLAAEHPAHLRATLHKVRILESIIRLAKWLVIQANLKQVLEQHPPEAVGDWSGTGLNYFSTLEIY